MKSRRSINSEQIGGKAGPPDLSGLVTDYFWRVNRERGYREHVRRSDGRVVTRERLRAAEALKTKSQATEENAMDETNKQQSTDSGPEKFGEFIVTGDARGYGGRERKAVTCSCGYKTTAPYDDLQSGALTFCGSSERHPGRPRDAKPLRARTARRTSTRKPARKAVRSQSRGAQRPAMPGAEQGDAPASRNGGDIQPPSVDFAALGEAIEGFTKMARLIPADQVKAMCAEIGLRAESLPAGDWGNLPEMRAQIEEGMKTARAFLEFRQSI